MIVRQSRRSRLLELEARLQVSVKKETVHHVRFTKSLMECLSEDYRDLSNWYFRKIAEQLLLTADEQIDQQRTARFPDPRIMVYTYGGDVPEAVEVIDGARWIQTCEDMDRRI